MLVAVAEAELEREPLRVLDAVLEAVPVALFVDEAVRVRECDVDVVRDFVGLLEDTSVVVLVHEADAVRDSVLFALFVAEEVDVKVSDEVEVNELQEPKRTWKSRDTGQSPEHATSGLQDTNLAARPAISGVSAAVACKKQRARAGER